MKLIDYCILQRPESKDMILPTWTLHKGISYPCLPTLDGSKFWICHTLRVQHKIKYIRIYDFGCVVPTYFFPLLYMVQSAWAWASSVISAPPPMVLGRPRNSRAVSTLFFTKSITWTSLKLQVKLGTVLHQEETWHGEQVVWSTTFWGDITWGHCNLAWLCDKVLHMIVIWLPLAYTVLVFFLACLASYIL